MNNILLDTNILVYAIDMDSVFHQRAKQVLIDENNGLYTTSKNISEYFAVCSKKNVLPEVIWGFYEDIKQNTTILFPNVESLLLLEQLLKKYTPRGNRIYDVEIVSIALTNHITQIATVNIDDFRTITEIQIVTI